jgi:hypothetical protein
MIFSAVAEEIMAMSCRYCTTNATARLRGGAGADVAAAHGTLVVDRCHAYLRTAANP